MDPTFYKVIDDLNLPYIKSVNPATFTDQPYLVGGQNTLSQPGLPLRRRPGFPTAGTVDFGANKVVKRVFTWQRWGGTFYTMYSVTDTSANSSAVYRDGPGTLVFTSTGNQEPFDYVVANNFLYFANGTDMKKYDGTTLTNWGISPQPSTAPTISNAGAGNVPGSIGHAYVYTYGVAATGYVSDISLQSLPTSAANRKWDVTGPKCTDAQCDQVHIYRNDDGGDIWYELSNSPIANPGGATWTIQDNDYDSTSLNTPRLQAAIPAPIAQVNNPPTPAKGPVFWAGRIWMFTGDTVIFSGYEEVTNGVAEESFGTLLTNSQSWGREVTGLAVLGGSDLSILLVFTVSGIFWVAGNSLLSFRIGTLSERRGCRNRAAIVSCQIDSENPSYGSFTTDFVAYLDISNSVRIITTASGIRDLSDPISPDILTINHSQASLTVFEDGNFRWLVLCDGGANVLRVLDLSSGKWNTPWPLTGGITATIIASGEISAGSHKLFLGTGRIALTLDRNTWNDNGTNYTSHIVTSLISLVEKDRPDRIAYLEHFGIERNSHDIADILYLLDEDPLTGSPTYTSFLANVAAPFLRNNTAAVNLVEKWYYLRDKAASRRLSVRINWAADNTDFALFTLAHITSYTDEER